MLQQLPMHSGAAIGIVMFLLPNLLDGDEHLVAPVGPLVVLFFARLIIGRAGDLQHAAEDADRPAVAVLMNELQP